MLEQLQFVNKVKKRTGTLFLFLMILTLISVPVKAAAVTDNLEDFVYTQENVMNLLNEVDPDGAYIVQYGIDNGDDIMEWYSDWSFSHASSVLNCIGTAVHEECHGDMFNHYYAGEWTGQGLDYYTGSRKYIFVKYTSVYKSEEMAAQIPSGLRTFRYDTYVAEDVGNSSNVEGIYGLLDEFTAYYWGVHTKNLISEKYGVWDQEQNIVEPYYEFLYWMTGYMIYAKNHYPQIYAGILNNKAFIEAFSVIEEKYRQEISSYIKKDVDELGDETKSLKNELAKDNYAEMLRIMKTGASESGTTTEKKSGETEPAKPGTTTEKESGTTESTESQTTVKENTAGAKIPEAEKSKTETVKNKNTASARTAEKKTCKLARAAFKTKSQKKKIRLTIRKVKKAKKYQIQYSLKKNFSSRKTLFRKSLKVTLKGLKSGKKYYVRVRAIGASGQKGSWSKVKSVRVK